MSLRKFREEKTEYFEEFTEEGERRVRVVETNTVWFEAFDAAPRREINYLKQMRRRGEKLNQAPRITLSTIHGAKGGEAENVVLLTDLSFNTMRGYEKNPDDENRLFYVGATRTKEHLHIIRPQQDNKGYDL